MIHAFLFRSHVQARSDAIVKGNVRCLTLLSCDSCFVYGFRV